MHLVVAVLFVHVGFDQRDNYQQAASTCGSPVVMTMESWVKKNPKQQLCFLNDFRKKQAKKKKKKKQKGEAASVHA